MGAERACGARSVQSSSVYDWIRRNEAAPAADLLGATSNGENLFEKNVPWARFTLSKRGEVVAPQRGIWALPKAKP